MIRGEKYHRAEVLRVIDLALRLHILGYIRFDIRQANYKTQLSTIIHGNNSNTSSSAGLGGCGAEELYGEVEARVLVAAT